MQTISSREFNQPSLAESLSDPESDWIEVEFPRCPIIQREVDF